MLRKYFQIRHLHNSFIYASKKNPFKTLHHDDPESFGDVESDFVNIDKTHRQHEEEIQLYNEQQRQHLVRQKYFRQPQLPNFLLYAEKEQIRSLHAQNSEEWTIPRLAESFPATADVIRKILKTSWRPYSLKRIKSHDESVAENWKRLTSDENGLELPKATREHLLKFLTRERQQDMTVEEVKEHYLPKLPVPRSKEFVSIIEKCKKYAGAPSEGTITKQLQTNKRLNQENYIAKYEKKQNMRLEDFKNSQIFKESSIAKEEHKDLFPILDGALDYSKEFEKNEIAISSEDKNKYEISIYKDRIHIPRKLWCKGSTYRVDDCYYDSDGEFLYRVPGMSQS